MGLLVRVQQLETAEKELAKTQEKLAAVRESAKQIEEDAFQVNKAYQESEGLLKHKQAEVNALKKEFSQLKSRVEKVCVSCVWCGCCVCGVAKPVVLVVFSVCPPTG